jgi:hypothetical protein
MSGGERLFALGVCLATAAIPLGLILASGYDDDHDQVSNALLPIGLIMAAAGVAVLAVLALVGLLIVIARALRRRHDDTNR